MPTQNLPIIVAKFDLTNDKQRTLRDAMERMHTGASPLWRALRMHQVGTLIYEAAECLPHVTGQPRRYSVVIWDLVECGVNWKPQPSRKAALSALDLPL
jgi:hypothetical protein